MPSDTGTTLRSRFLKSFAGAALALAACAGLAGCGGGGSGGGAEVMITPGPQNPPQAAHISTQDPQPLSQGSPDMVVESPSVSDPGPSAGANFTLSVRVRNAGDGAAPAATLRFYRSADAAVSTSDAQVGSAAVAELAASGSAAASVALTAPRAPGTYYYGACVDAVEGESDAANNCSAAVRRSTCIARQAADLRLFNEWCGQLGGKHRFTADEQGVETHCGGSGRRRRRCRLLPFDSLRTITTGRTLVLESPLR